MLVGQIEGTADQQQVTKRRKLPSPPLILYPHFGRYPVGGFEAEKLLKLADFLKELGVLTKGGDKSLSDGLRGRNGVVSIGLQDVRSWAHGLVEELVGAISEPDSWQSVAASYSRRFDRGKPRRPTHLQRLYLQWSTDYSWSGLLRVCRLHPHLWDELNLAVERLSDDTQEKRILETALACRDSFEPWVKIFESETYLRVELLKLLPLLPPATPEWRLKFLSDWVSHSSPDTELARAVIKATLCQFSEAKDLTKVRFSREKLQSLALESLGAWKGSVDPNFVAAFRSFVCSEVGVQGMLAGISESDPLRTVYFGARPGTAWLDQLATEMRQIIALL